MDTFDDIILYVVYTTRCGNRTRLFQQGGQLAVKEERTVKVARNEAVLEATHYYCPGTKTIV